MNEVREGQFVLLIVSVWSKSNVWGIEQKIKRERENRWIEIGKETGKHSKREGEKKR